MISSAALVCCSDGRKNDEKDKIALLQNKLGNIFAQVKPSKYIYAQDTTVTSGTAKQRAMQLTDFFAENTSHIFDISGGDAANEILPFLDYDIIGKSNSLFWGYSDLTTVINAVYTKTGKPSVLYQIRNVVGGYAALQEKRVNDYFSGSSDLFDVEYRMLVGSGMSGTVVGGNIRCLLKLAGTEFFPDLNGKILLLESLGGGEARMRACLSQLKQLGVFEKINGIILGTFTEMEKNNIRPTMEELLLDITESKIPVAKTDEIGHGSDSKAIFIGKETVIQS